MNRSISGVSAAVLALACTAPPNPAPVPASAPAATTVPGASPPAPSAPTAPQSTAVPLASTEPVSPPADALKAGWMPLASTGVDGFRREHPKWDGRGVLIGILDSGVDPGVSGLGRTSTGEPKLLDLRDFSGEGRIALSSVQFRGDSVVIGGHALKAPPLPGGSAIWGGSLAELPLGDMPAADVNGDGDNEDVLPLLVIPGGGGWQVLADTDGDGSLADEKPVRDDLAARETFAWHTGDNPAPVTVAVNLATAPCSATACPAPTLDLYFDTSSHGTHVAGIAAGHNMYDVPGFDGVAPGAQLLGLKIANDAQGGISVSGGMQRAIDYAIRFAAERKLPLVLNLSFGVGNEVEGRARIDAMIDSVLAAHPDVVFTIAAGNDGPGLSTLGFPGSARRAISVGALMPGVFLSDSPERKVPDQIASFSARGGEYAAPDLLAPGMAYSTVPRWNVGGEREGGTSMASPHAAGLAAVLVSALESMGVDARAVSIRQALMATARPLPGGLFVDQGAGVPDVARAWAWLKRGTPPVAISVVTTSSRHDAVILRNGVDVRDTVLAAVVTAPRQTGALRYRSDVPWLSASINPGARQLLELRLARNQLTAPGVYGGLVTAWTADTLLGPLAWVPVTVVVPHPVRSTDLAPVRIAVGKRLRVPFMVEAGRAARLRVQATGGTNALTWLHEPGGMPFRSGAQLQAGQGNDAAYDITAGEAEGGVYELVVEPQPGEPVTVQISIDHAPVDFRAERQGDGVLVTLRGLSDAPVDVEPLALLTGTVQSWTVDAKGDGRQSHRVMIPRWARAIQVDVNMEREQWDRFTDLGMTLFDTAGHQIGKTPLNYAFGRLELLVPESMRGQPADLVWFPGFADPAAERNRPWRLNVQARFYADSASALPRAQETIVKLEKGGTRTLQLPWRMPPWGETNGETPLGALLVRSGEEIFIRELMFDTANTTRATSP